MDKMKKVKKKEKWQKNLPSSTGIWTPDFWTKLSRQKFDPSPLGFEPQIFGQNFLAQDLNFEGD